MNPSKRQRPKLFPEVEKTDRVEELEELKPKEETRELCMADFEKNNHSKGDLE